MLQSDPLLNSFLDKAFESAAYLSSIQTKMEQKILLWELLPVSRKRLGYILLDNLMAFSTIFLDLHRVKTSIYGPYKVCRCPYLDLSTNMEIYRSNMDIYRLCKDLYMSNFALCDKRKYKHLLKNVEILACLFFEPEHDSQMLAAFGWSSLYPVWLSLTNVE